MNSVIIDADDPVQDASVLVGPGLTREAPTQLQLELLLELFFISVQRRLRAQRREVIAMDDKAYLELAVEEAARRRSASLKAKLFEGARVRVLPDASCVSGPIDTPMKVAYNVLGDPEFWWKAQVQPTAWHSVEVRLGDIQEG